MAISPPSDLVLDVIKAADPVALKDATAKLKRLSRIPVSEAMSFAETFEARAPKFHVAGVHGAAAPVEAASRQTPVEKFEALILHQFVETMLPDDAANVFGEGATGEIWKSMLAEQVGNQMAASGGIGIADLLSDNLKDKNKA
ncbi:rod-binding protein [Roseibium sp.]|uniref:rod-binding protein n=1 Tax=Roseibium sp. TaxID=1936156 RepID=UPI003A9789A1